MRKLSLLLTAAFALSTVVVGVPEAVAQVPAAVAQAPKAAAAGSVTLRFMTANVDFTASPATVKEKLNAVIDDGDPDIVFLQEAREVKLAKIVEPKVWIIRHGTVSGERDSSDRLGSAVLIRRSVVTKVKDFGLVKGASLRSTDPGGCRMQTRWITKLKVKVANGRWVRIASLHMPPADCQEGSKGPYVRMASSVVKLVKRSGMLTVLGADWNKNVDADPNNIGKRSGLTANGLDKGDLIDGFLYSPTLGNDTLEPTSIGVVSYHHRAVQITFTIPAP